VLIPKEIEDRWETMVDACKPGDFGQQTETWLSGQSPAKVIVGVLPEACSRHNSPARPHSIASLLKGRIPAAGEIAIILVLEEADHAVASTSAVARAIPSFTRKTSTAESRKVSIALIVDDEKPFDADELQIRVEARRFAARLVDTPASELHTEAFVELARETAASVGAEISVLEAESLAHAGLGGLWGVGKAATHPPALVVLDYTPEGGGESTVGWVGKGIVYDTGGLSIKGKTGMPGMKTDMGGAAAVLAAFRAAVKLKPKHRILALLCLAENSVGPDATRPDDVLNMYSGLTVEVNNTDAEGRLVLADGVAYLTRHYTPDVVIDLATLTGAQMVATGQRHAGIVCNDEALESKTVLVGRQTGDLVHPLPYCPEFFRNEFKSPVADMKNSVKDRLNAQSSCAGQFIANHLVDYEGPWLHIDLAGPSTDGERATGYGTNLLLTLLDL
jgi:probable aminopeptidase NPEPL1